MSPLANVPKGSFHSAMQQHSLKNDALINPYHSGKVVTGVCVAQEKL